MENEIKEAIKAALKCSDVVLEAADMEDHILVEKVSVRWPGGPLISWWTPESPQSDVEAALEGLEWDLDIDVDAVLGIRVWV